MPFLFPSFVINSVCIECEIGLFVDAFGKVCTSVEKRTRSKLNFVRLKPFELEYRDHLDFARPYRQTISVIFPRLKYLRLKLKLACWSIVN